MARTNRPVWARSEASGARPAAETERSSWRHHLGLPAFSVIPTNCRDAPANSPVRSRYSQLHTQQPPVRMTDAVVSASVVMGTTENQDRRRLMTAASRDPNQIHSELEGAEEYQAPPREHEQDAEDAPAPVVEGNPADVWVLEAQRGRRKSKMSETKPHAAPPPKLRCRLGTSWPTH